MSRSYSSLKAYMESVCLSWILPFPHCAHLPRPGQSIAYAWYFAGCRTLDDVRKRKGGIKLSSVQEIGLKYYDGTHTPTQCVGTGIDYHRYKHEDATRRSQGDI